MLKLLVIADDLTGANDTAVQFARQNIPAPVSCNGDFHVPSDTEVLVVNIESRHVNPEIAAERVRNLVDTAVKAGVQYFYKKTDSTLRGNVGAELTALIRAGSSGKLAFVPAYPQMQRFTRNGYQYIGSTLLHETDLRFDPLEPVTDSYVPAIINRQSDCAVHGVTRGSYCEETSLPDEAILVFDCQSHDDLTAISGKVAADTALRLFAGPAAFAAMLPSFIKFTSKEQVCDPVVTLPLLFVNGSLNPVSLRQIEIAKQADIPVFVVPGACWTAAPRDAAWKDFMKQIELEHSRPGAIILTSVSSEHLPRRQKIPNFEGLHNQVADTMGMLTTGLSQKKALAGFVVFGGDTLSGVLRALSIDLINPVDEILPGMPVMLMPGTDMFLVSKAGGFGDDDLVLRTLNHFKGVN